MFEVFYPNSNETGREELRKLTSRSTGVVPSDVEMVEDEIVEIEESIK